MAINPALINLDSLLNFSAKLNETYDELFILNSALLSIMGKLKISRTCVIKPIDGDNYKILLVKGGYGIEKRIFGEGANHDRLFTLEEAELNLAEAGFVQFIPVLYQQKTLAVICLGRKADSMPVSEEEEQYLSLICTILANALQNAHNHQSLLIEKGNVERRHQLLTTLFEIGRDFSSLLSREQIIKMLSFHLMGQLMISRFAVYLLLEGGGFEQLINRFPIVPDEKILESLIRLEQAMASEDLKSAEDVTIFMKDLNLAMVSPMVVQGKVKGLMLVGSKMTGEKYSRENIRFIEAIGNTAIASLENERLFRQEVEKKTLESELSLALEIQRNLLPTEIPSTEKFSLAGASYPSRHVGGDYFDFIRLDESRMLIAIADVSGKGMPASLIMANVQAALRLLSPMNLCLRDIVLKINSLIFHNTTPDKFVTFFSGILDIHSGHFEYINAGHNPPIFISSGGNMQMLREGGLIIGFLEEPFEYHYGEITIGTGDCVVLYTDGVTEAVNAAGKDFGEKMLIETVSSNAAKNADEILRGIVDSVREFSAGLGQADDITCIVIKGK